MFAPKRIDDASIVVFDHRQLNTNWHLHIKLGLHKILYFH